MFKSFRNASIPAIIAALLLGGGCLALGLLYLNETERNQQLEQRLAELDKQVKKGEIDKRINEQMEEIADGQSIIAKKQAKIAEENANEAKEQAQIAEANANEAKEQTKIAEANAIEAKKQAEIAEANANEAKRQAEIADHNKSVADTLFYIALGRSLGSQSSQIRANDETIADLLAYASYHFTDRYKQNESNLYNSVVFNALTEGSHTKQTWAKHKGLVTGISFDRDATDGRFVTTSSYGEIMCHTFDDVKNVLTKTETIFANSQYDFRDVIYKKGTIYALSFTGHLVVKKDEWNSPRIILLPGIFRPTAFCEMGDNDLCIIGSQSVGIFDKNSLTLTGAKSFDFNIVCLGKDFNSLPILFDNYGRMHILKSLNEITTKKVPQGVVGQVTAYANSKGKRLEAYGTKSGIIYIVNRNNEVTTLAGHESKVTKLKLVNEKVYSSSYDGNLNLWIFHEGKNEKVEPLTLLDTHEWMLGFDFDGKKERVWTCGQNGTVTKSLIKIDLMVEKMQTEILKRDLSQEEWNYYIGTNIPYVKFIGKEGGK